MKNSIEEKLIGKLDELIARTEQILAGEKQVIGIDEELFYEYKMEARSFISRLYGDNHNNYNVFRALTQDYSIDELQKSRGVLKAIRNEISSGFINDLKGLVSAELFSDFIEMAEHLLEESYKDPAAVIIGSVLEEHLRQLCTKHEIEITVEKDGKTVSKKASAFNVDLAKKGVLSKLDHKMITAWLDLRNNAAHGKYTEYSKEQVEQFLLGVQSFVSRNPL